MVTRFNAPQIFSNLTLVITSCFFAVDSTATLKPKDISSVQTHLWPARHKWRRIGMAVEIDPTTLEVIQMDNRRTDDCFTDVLTKWLRSNKPSPCWKNLTTALQSVEIKVLLGKSCTNGFLSCDCYNIMI